MEFGRAFSVCGGGEGIAVLFERLSHRVRTVVSPVIGLREYFTQIKYFTQMKYFWLLEISKYSVSHHETLYLEFSKSQSSDKMKVLNRWSECSYVTLDDIHLILNS